LRNSFVIGLTAFLLATRLTPGGQDATGSNSRVFDLSDCIALALNESPALEASRLEVASATEDARSARGQALPKIDAGASYQLFSGSPTSKFSIVQGGGSIAVGVNNAVNLGAVEAYSAHLSYPLFRDGSILGLNTAPAEASKLARRRNLAWTSRLRREDVIARITDAFIVTVSAENRAGYAERRVKLLQQEVDITQEQQKQGLTLPIDLKLARNQLSSAETLSKILRQQAIAGKIEMARALGFDSPDDFNLSSELPEPPEPPSAELLLGPSLNQHPSLEAQKAVIEQARQDYRLERFRLYPSVTLEGSAVHIDDFGPSSADVYAGIVSVNVPIFDFGAQEATTRARLAKYQAERARLASVSDDVTFEIVTIYQSIYVLSQNILTLQQDVAKADRDLQVTSSEREQGIAAPLAAIEKELHLIAKRDDLDGLQVRRLMLYAALQKAAGGAWKWVR
jgi:outer membrane protein, multidrug efflux system